MTDSVRGIGRTRGLRLLAGIGLALAVLGVVALLGSGLGTRWGWWSFRTGFAVLRWGAYAGVAGAAVSLAAMLGFAWRRAAVGTWLALAGFVLGAVAAGVPWRLLEAARASPPIHDITTDTDRPPEFVVLAPARAESPNGVAYGGPAVAARQRAAYPDIEPLRLALPPDRVLAAAAAAAREMGWTVAAVDGDAGRLEATARTRWFGFYDDVVVRVTPEGSGSRVDVRSASRVGLGDIGTNARRVREFLGRLSRAVAPETRSPARAGQS